MTVKERARNEVQLLVQNAIVCFSQLRSWRCSQIDAYDVLENPLETVINVMLLHNVVESEVNFSSTQVEGQRNSRM